MTIRNLDKIFRPKSIAVVGASDRAGSVGGTVLANLRAGGFPGPVTPIHVKHKTVGGLAAFPTIKDVPQRPDLAIICTPARTVPEIIDQCGAAGVWGVLVIAAGFHEAGAAGRALEEELLRRLRPFPEMRLLGPNCLGVVVPEAKLNASFAGALPAAGSVAFISQSGALGTSVLDWARAERIGLSHFISLGNMLDIGFGDAIDYVASDPTTRAIVLYLESVTQAREFLSAARAAARQKPIVAYKAGRFKESARAAASHTGAMVGEDAVYDAAFDRAGIVRVDRMDELFDCAELLARHMVPRGPRLAIVTNAGGMGVIAADALLAARAELAPLEAATLERLGAVLPAGWSRGNPVDVLGDAPPDRFGRAVEIVLDDGTVDALLVILTPQAMTDPAETARVVAKVVAGRGEPVAATWVGGDAVREGTEILSAAGIATFATPDQGAKAFADLVRYARNLETLYETPRELPMSFSLDQERFRELFGPMVRSGARRLGHVETKMLLAAYEIPVTKTYVAKNAEQAAELARLIGYPVVLKIVAPSLLHKTEVDGVRVGLDSESSVRAAHAALLASARTKVDSEELAVSVEPMVDTRRGVELILGAKRDATFGTVLMVGLGGVAAEVLGDRSLGLPPLNEKLALRMLKSLKCWPLLAGFRGRPEVNLDRLTEVLMRLSYLVTHFPEILELDINPLFVSDREVVALDGRMLVDPQDRGEKRRPFAHLAIRPYPEEFVHQRAARDGTPITVRPIRPEDEPLWKVMFERCSEETIYRRFFSHVRPPSHETAIRYCVIDYDREMALVAEGSTSGQRELWGVSRLVEQRSGGRAEFAVLVADPWQGTGIGSLLTDECLQVAETWGIEEVFAEVLAVNATMLGMLARRGFAFQRDGDVVLATKLLATKRMGKSGG